MQSAFGVEHGDVSKALPGAGVLKPMASAFKLGAKGMKGPMQTAGQGRALAAGGMTRRVGQFGMRNKKAIGAGLGVGAVGGATGAAMNRRA